MKFLKIACLLFSMFFFSSLASAEETVISVSGPDILTDGACYSATGGETPYLWKTSEGSMDSGGCVSNVSAQCGTATIIASDDCRVIGSKAVTLHGGVGAISVSGTDAPQNGSCYVANNAVGAVQWGITKGSINSNGCVSGISSQCGAATITATDSCGETVVKDVRMPSGVWITTWGCTIYSGSTCNSKTGYVYSGSLRFYSNYTCSNSTESCLSAFMAQGGILWEDTYPDCSVLYGFWNNISCAQYGNINRILKQGWIAEWRCQ